MAIELSTIRHIGLFTPDLAAHSQFYTDVWGLQLVSRHADAAYFRGSSAEYFLLSLHASSKKGLHHVAFGVGDVDAVKRTADALAAAGVRLLDQPANLDEPGGGYGFRFIDPDGRCIEISANTTDHADGWMPRRVEPREVCHVVLNTPDIDRITSFYTDIMGFRISDWSEHQMVFLRCNTKHHAISFNQAPHASVNHIAYLVSGVDEVMRGVSTLRGHGIEPAWGPGRHGPGNNIFCYFRDPFGYVTEYTSDIDYIADDAAHVPKVWARGPESIDRWGLAGPPTSTLREAMTGEPDTGWAKGKERTGDE